MRELRLSPLPARSAGHGLRSTVLLTATLWALLGVVACGSPKIEPAATPKSDVGVTDAGQQDTGSGVADTGAATDSGAVDAGDPTVDEDGWHIGPDAGIDFTGQGSVGVFDDKVPGDMLKTRLDLTQTKEPEKDKAYVWWMEGPAAKGKIIENFGALLQDEKVWAATFSVEDLSGAAGAGPNIGNFNRAFITYEDLASADQLDAPIGPIVWRGEIPIPVWVHIKHVLTQRDGPGGLPGYIQISASIMNALQKELGNFQKALDAGKPKLATKSAEIMYYLLVGPDNVKTPEDLNGDGSIDTGSAKFTMGFAISKTSPLIGARKHARSARDAAKAIGPVADSIVDGLSALEEGTGKFYNNIDQTLNALKGFASGKSKNAAGVKGLVATLQGNFKQALVGAKLMGQINLER